MMIASRNDYIMDVEGAVQVVGYEPSTPSRQPLYRVRRSIKDLAALQSTRFRGIADNDEGKSALLFVYETESSAHYFTTGYFDSLRQAVEFTRLVFLNEDIEMNIFKNTKLFPNIRGVMLKENRTTLTMNGKVKVVEMREGNDARAEIFFSDHPKTAIINRTQLMDIADVYGPETEEWAGMPVVIYGEEGTWFGKHSWGIRVDLEATRKAAKNVKKAKPKKNGNPETVDDIPFDPDDEELAEMIFNDNEQSELFPD